MDKPHHRCDIFANVSVLLKITLDKIGDILKPEAAFKIPKSISTSSDTSLLLSKHIAMVSSVRFVESEVHNFGDCSTRVRNRRHMCDMSIASSGDLWRVILGPNVVALSKIMSRISEGKLVNDNVGDVCIVNVSSKLQFLS